MFNHQKRIYTPKNPEKYIGESKKSIMRSSWETKFAIWADLNSLVHTWSSESTVIPYVCPTDNKPHRYYVDFHVQFKLPSGLLKTFLVEVKPQNQVEQPKYPGKQTQAYKRACAVWIKNQAKWKAAKQYALDRGWDFVVLNEYDLGIKQRPPK